MSDRQVIRQTRQEIASFLGNQGGAELFTKLFIETSPGYFSSVNDNDAKNIVNFPHAYNLMKAEDYNNKDSGMSNNDVHWEFTDQIINYALYLKLIDTPTGRSAFTKGDFDSLMNAKVSDVTNSATLFGQLITSAWVGNYSVFNLKSHNPITNGIWSGIDRGYQTLGITKADANRFSNIQGLLTKR